MSVKEFIDRSICVQPGQIVKTAWISIDDCVLGNRSMIVPEAVEKKWRMLLQQGKAAPWPPIVGHWKDNGRFSVDDGRHEFIANLMHGREKVFVAWLAKEEE